MGVRAGVPALAPAHADPALLQAACLLLGVSLPPWPRVSPSCPGPGREGMGTGPVDGPFKKGPWRWGH